MKKNFIKLILYGFTALLISSCVAKRRLVSAQGNIQQLKNDSAQQSGQIQALNQSNYEMQSNFARLEEARNRLQQQLDNTRNEASKRLNASQDEINKSREQIADQQKRLEHLQALIAEQRVKTEELRKKIADALVSFNANELTIHVKDGKVYVSLQESLLFPSASAEVNPKGKQALGQLAAVLNVNPDIAVNIEGHTDSIPINDARYKDNWALSTARANSIVRVLTDGYKVDPTRITASGKSYYDPVDVNLTSQGRANNRRTEIILEPKLDELMKLIQG